ncbi:MAG: hypothetical protein RQ761_01060 [Bacteroidales bacterium]|nr:hypothetical protein [Bacteroidales bacterium]
MRNILLLLAMLLLMTVFSCEKDLDVVKWKEVSVVYAVINLKDSVQYLRINRMFTAPGTSPYEYMQVNDSVNYPHELFDAFLEEYRNNELFGEPVAYIPVEKPKIPGLFSNGSNCVFKVSAPINVGSTYKLRVINKETGKEMSAETHVLGSMNIEASFEWERAYFRVNYIVENLQYDGSLDPYDHRHYIVRFLYWESKNGLTSHKYVDWFPTFDPLKNISGDDTSYQLFDDYYRYLSEQIPVDPSVKRKARGVDYMLALPGKELQNYITVTSQPTNPHFYPDYSNMTGGEGVFGSKYFYTYFGMKLKKQTIDTISWGKHMINHRFADSRGEWH